MKITNYYILPSSSFWFCSSSSASSSSCSSGWITPVPSGKSISWIGLRGLLLVDSGLKKSGNSGRSMSLIGLEKSFLGVSINSETLILVFFYYSMHKLHFFSYYLVHILPSCCGCSSNFRWHSHHQHTTIIEINFALAVRFSFILWTSKIIPNTINWKYYFKKLHSGVI